MVQSRYHKSRKNSCVNGLKDFGVCAGYRILPGKASTRTVQGMYEASRTSSEGTQRVPRYQA